MADLISILDAADPRVRDYTGLTDVSLRRIREPAEGLFLAEGEKVIKRALAAGYRPRSLFMATRWWDGLASELESLDCPVYLADESVLRAVTGFNVHRGALASMARVPLRSVSDVIAGATRVVVLEDLVDHTNVGAIFRNAAALGIDAVLVSPECADPLYRRSIKVSMGSVFAVPWTRADPWPNTLDLLRVQGFSTIAMSPDPRGTPLNLVAPCRRAAIVLGTEGEGLTPAALARCEESVRIPMSAGVDSLNVAAASAVVFYALNCANSG